MAVLYRRLCLIYTKRKLLTTLKKLRFADDIALLANTKRKLEEALNVTETVFNNYNMKINIKKTKVIVCRSKLRKKRLNIKIGNEKIAEISEFCYLPWRTQSSEQSVCSTVADRSLDWDRQGRE